MAFHTEGRARVIADRLRSLRVTDGPRSTLGRLPADSIPKIAHRIAATNHAELTDAQLRNFVVNQSIREPMNEQSLQEIEGQLRALRGRPE